MKHGKDRYSKTSGGKRESSRPNMGKLNKHPSESITDQVRAYAKGKKQSMSY